MVAVQGGPPVSVTDDPAVDWNPVWSPDGKYLYFASDRGGSMNLWRIALDESSGQVLERPEPVTTPATYSGFVSLARGGQRLAYAQVNTTNNLQQLGFDPAREKVVGAPHWITQGSRIATNPSLSPDGEWFAFDAIGEKQEDLFIIRRDGTGQRQLTDDIYKDRAPVWSPDGQKLLFFSDRNGKYDSYTINPDASGLQQITYLNGPGTMFSLWSPDGTRFLFNLQAGAPILLATNKR